MENTSMSRSPGIGLFGLRVVTAMVVTGGGSGDEERRQPDGPLAGRHRRSSGGNKEVCNPWARRSRNRLSPFFSLSPSDVRAPG